MHVSDSERALRRLLAYLQWSGVVITPEVEKCALQVIAEQRDEADSERISTCLQRLGCVARQAMPGAAVAPAIRRGSIAYGEY